MATTISTNHQPHHQIFHFQSPTSLWWGNFPLWGQTCIIPSHLLPVSLLSSSRTDLHRSVGFWNRPRPAFRPHQLYHSPTYTGSWQIRSDVNKNNKYNLILKIRCWTFDEMWMCQRLSWPTLGLANLVGWKVGRHLDQTCQPHVVKMSAWQCLCQCEGCRGKTWGVGRKCNHAFFFQGSRLLASVVNGCTSGHSTRNTRTEHLRLSVFFWKEKHEFRNPPQAHVTANTLQHIIIEIVHIFASTANCFKICWGCCCSWHSMWSCAPLQIMQPLAMCPNQDDCLLQNYMP